MSLRNNRRQAWIRLLAAIFLATGTWLIFLPMIGKWSVVRDHIERLDERDIDASAMYYTDLNAMPAIITRAQQAVRENQATFYIPGEASGATP